MHTVRPPHPAQRAPRQWLARIVVQSVALGLSLNLSVVYSQTTVQDAGMVGPVYEVVRLTYNNPVERFGAWEPGVASLQTLHRYDQQGRQIIFESESPIGVVHTRHEYTYDTDGGVRRDTYSGDTFSSYSVTSPNLSGRAFYAEYSSTGVLTYQADYTYDSDGRMVGMRGYSPNGTVRLASNYSYDEEGRMLSNVSFNPDGTEASGNHWRYDSEGRSTRSWVTSGGAVSRFLLYRYEDNVTAPGRSGVHTFMYADSYFEAVADPATYVPVDASRLFETDVHRFIPEYRSSGEFLQTGTFEYLFERLTVFHYNFDAMGNITRIEEGEIERRFGEEQFVPNRITTIDVTYYDRN